MKPLRQFRHVTLFQNGVGSVHGMTRKTNETDLSEECLVPGVCQAEAWRHPEA